MKTAAFILKGYPRLSETFIAQEILSLERLGLGIEIISLRHPTDSNVHPVHREICAPISYLPEYLYRESFRVLRALFSISRRPRFRIALRTWLKDLLRDPTPNRVRRFGQAIVLANEMTPHIEQLHAHVLHTPASVARYTSLLTGIPWSVSAHAKDIWTTPDWEKREKLATCEWAVTCTATGFYHLKSMAPDDRLRLVYHGLDLERFSPPLLKSSLRNGSDAGHPIILLSIGRAVEKKGLDSLLTALQSVPEHVAWRLVHIGGGPLLDRLKQAADRAGLTDRIQWLGPQPQEIVLENYRAADLFILPSIVAKNGDRDGLPNVLLEAQSQGLACISANLPSIAELISDGRTGVLVEPGDSAALAEAISSLAQDPQRRRTLGDAALEHVHERFTLSEHIGRLASLFGLPPTTEDEVPCELPSTLP